MEMMEMTIIHALSSFNATLPISEIMCIWITLVQEYYVDPVQQSNDFARVATNALSDLVDAVCP